MIPCGEHLELFLVIYIAVKRKKKRNDESPAQDLEPYSSAFIQRGRKGAERNFVQHFWWWYRQRVVRSTHKCLFIVKQKCVASFKNWKAVGLDPASGCVTSVVRERIIVPFNVRLIISLSSECLMYVPVDRFFMSTLSRQYWNNVRCCRNRLLFLRLKSCFMTLVSNSNFL